MIADKTTIIVKQTATGWLVQRHKTRGVDKGLTTIAATCGGQIGRIVAVDAASMAMLFCMADELTIEAFDTEHLEAMREDIAIRRMAAGEGQ